MFDPVDPKQSFPDLERGILQYWKEEDLFKRSMSQRASVEGTDNTFAFYDGPPFATGLPHYGHILAGTIKDVIPRYQTMQGKFVERRFGWDCHGLPIENLIEKEHNLKSKRDIEAIGVRAFNDLCRKSVLRYTEEWRKTVERVGRWVDMDWDYRTMDANFMESIWWVFGELWNKKLIYEDYKPMYICPRCATPLSNFEVTQGYKDRTDQSVIMTFPLVDDPNTVILAWTTTPWSLPGNMWLAIGLDISYVKVKGEDGKTYILAEKLVEKVFGKKEHTVMGNIDAKELLGKKYTPLFPYFVDTVLPSTKNSKKPQTYGERVFKVIVNEAVAVSDAEGTGIVHLTSSTGEDSFAVATAEKVDIMPHVQMDGYFTAAVTDLKGLHAKPEGDDPMSTDKKVIEYLKAHDRAFSTFTVNHSYPHCWRCDTPLLPSVTRSWFVSVEAIKKDMLKANSETEWVPAHLRDGRFGKWLENARDWAISRSRYWGTPLPIWRCEETGTIEVIASRDELMKRKPERFTKITLVRHGESEGNVSYTYQGTVPGTDLTERGRAQAKTAGEFLSTQDVHVIYASPFARTQQTADVIAEETDADVISEPRVGETAFGKYEGTAVERKNLELRKQRRAEKLLNRKIESINHLSGMETWEEVKTRVESFLNEVLPKHRGEHIVIVTHGDPMRAMKHLLTKEDPFKISQQPYPEYGEPHAYFWDHERQAEMDLHKDVIDDIVWPAVQDSEMVHVTFVRHGETDWNVEGRCTGSADRPLTDTGRDQAKTLHDQLNEQDFDVVLTSNLVRASETADIVTKGWKLQPVINPLFREQSFGTTEGKTLDDIRQTDPAYVERMLRDIVDTPEGESRAEVLARAREAETFLLENYKGKRVLIISHARFISAMAIVTQNAQGHTMMKNGSQKTMKIGPMFKRIPDVLDCWFESGSMPYAQPHYPFNSSSFSASGTKRSADSGKQLEKKTELTAHFSSLTAPRGFPADFIAEGIDQTRGWFYTLTVLSAALFKKSSFKHCVVNGTVLASDGKKMSKRLKNYPEPLEIVEKYGADSVRFALMNSPAVRAEDLRFSEKTVEETLRSVILPLWNTYAFFVTYANMANWEPASTRRHSTHPLDIWITTEVQDLVNRMTHELDQYDLSATCGELFDTVDALTNWYVRLSRRRFAGKSGFHDAEGSATDDDQTEALSTLYHVLLTLSQVLAPFCPFVTDAIYGNLSKDEHGSVHLTDWPKTRTLTKEEEFQLKRQRTLRTIVSLGLSIRSEQKIKVRQPLAKASIAVPASLRDTEFSQSELQMLQEELNVKMVEIVDDAGTLAEEFVQVDARKVGPRLGGHVQDIIKAGKSGDFTVRDDGTILILEEVLSPEEASVVYRGKEGQNVAANKGIVVSLDFTVTDELKVEGMARDLIRAIQQLRKDNGYELHDQVTVTITGAEHILEHFGDMIAKETNIVFGDTTGDAHNVDIDDASVTITMRKKN